MSSTGISVGLNRGFPVTKHEVGARPSNSKAVSAILEITVWKFSFLTRDYFVNF